MASSRGRFAELAIRCLVLAMAAGLWSCRDLEVPEPFPCSRAGNCPAPYRCGRDNMCRLLPFDGGVDGTAGGGGSAGGTGGRGGAGGSVAGSGGGGTGGSAGTGGFAGSVGSGGTGGSVGGTGGIGGTSGSGGTGGGAAGRGGTGGTAGTGGSTGGRGGTGGTGGSTGGTGGAAGRGGTGGSTGGTGGSTAGTGGTGGTAGTGGTGDTTRPQIVDASPSNGQTGVASSAKIVVTFSEAMNQTAVRNAYSSARLPPAQVTFSWNAAGTILTITPNSPLLYASGTSPTIPATLFMFEISTAATDLAGNGLAATFSSSFTTLRRITSSIPGTNVFNLWDSTPIGPSGVVPNACTPTDGNTVGRSVSLAFTSVRKLYITLQIPSAPTGVTAVETAVFRGLQTQVGGGADPYSMSALTADEIPFQGAPGAASNTIAPIRSLGTFSTSASTLTPQMDVTATFAQSFIAAGQETPVMIRLQFGALPSVESLAYFSCTGFLATWTYLVP